MRAILTSFFLLLSLAYLSAQHKLDVNQSCSYVGELTTDDLYGFSSDSEAEDALKRIMRYTGLPANFTIEAANVPNAAAVIQGDKRFILYNQYFMLRVKDQTKTDWAALSILAHEIGHHLSGHTLDNVGSRPDKELEADRFSGFILYKMGASLEEARVAMENLASESGSSTHPPRSARLAAITNGWLEAQDLNEDVKPIGPDTKPTTPTTTTKPPTTTTKPPTTTTTKPLAPTSYFYNLWVDYDVFEGGKKGMRLHVNFNVKNLKGQECRAVAWFYDANTDKPIPDKNGLFNTSDGQVSVGMDFNPGYEDTEYDDLSIFMPYEELHVTGGTFNLKFQVGLFSKIGGQYNQIGNSSQFIFFDYSDGTRPALATFQNIWVDYDVWEAGVKGMRIHVKFNIQNAQSKPCRIVAWFYDDDNVPLFDYNDRYNTVDGKVSVGEGFTPPYSSTDFNDFDLFIPYDELHMRTGVHDLKFNVGLFLDDNGYSQVGESSDYVLFTLTK